MLPIKKPSTVSNEAWSILEAVHKNYVKNDTTHFEDFSQFDFSQEDLIKYCQELMDNKYVFLEKDGDGQMYLYMLPKTLGCVRD